MYSSPLTLKSDGNKFSFTFRYCLKGQQRETNKKEQPRKELILKIKQKILRAITLQGKWRKIYKFDSSKIIPPLLGAPLLFSPTVHILKAISLYLRNNFML